MNDQPTKALTDAEFERVQKVIMAYQPLVEDNMSIVAQPRAALMLELLMRTGMRPDELMGLTMGSFNVERSSVWVNGSKGSLDRDIPLDEDFMKRFAARMLVHPLRPKWPIATWLTSNAFTPMAAKKAISRAWKKYASMALGKLQADTLGVYCLRHTFATRCYAATGDIRHVQLIMGHRNINSTMRYVYAVDLKKLKSSILKAAG